MQDMAFVQYRQCTGEAIIVTASDVIVSSLDSLSSEPSKRFKPYLAASVSGPANENGAKQKSQSDDSESNSDDEQSDRPQENASKSQVLCCCFDTKQELLAVCNNQKQLIVWNAVADWTLQASATLCKQATAVCFAILSSEVSKESSAADTRSILVADRAGNVTKFSLPDCANATVILGHVSMLLDIKLNHRSDMVVTCDRDEKIRVSRFPDAFNIETYCLGHKDYVRSVAFVEPPFHHDALLVSASGDGTAKLWDYSSGALLASEATATERVDDSAEATFVQPQKVLAHSSNETAAVIALLYTTSPIVSLFNVVSDIPSSTVRFNSRLHYSLVDAKPAVILDGCFDEAGQLLLLSGLSVLRLSIPVAADASSAFEVTQAAFALHSTIASALTACKDELPLTSKATKFGNLEEYRKRKEDRIQSITSKKQKLSA